jgi:DNA-entry nuclease
MNRRRKRTRRRRNPYEVPAIIVAFVLSMLILAIVNGKLNEVVEQAFFAKTETTPEQSPHDPAETTPEQSPHNPAETTPEISQDEEAAQPDAAEDEFTLSMVPAYAGNAYVDIHDDVPFFREEELVAESFQEYWPLDELGRCTGAYACIGPDSLPTEAREDISSVVPTGWHSVQYEGIDRDYLYNRCHLIGYQLTGQSANEKNLITGTRYMNVEGMLPFENSVRMYVEGTGNHVLYRVRPYYHGDDLVAAGVLMEAKSIEDPLVQFCAFCYNVQPGIEIDYATGDSAVKKTPDSEDILPIERSFESGEGTTTTRSIWKETASEETVEITYVINTNTKRFHNPYCESVGDMKDKNKLETTLSREEIIRQGYAPCKRCNP